MIGNHRVEDGCRPLARSRAMAERLELRRSPDQAGQHRRFRHGQIDGALIEVKPRRRHAIGAIPQVHPVKIAGENFVFAQTRFQPDSQQRFTQLASISADNRLG